MKRIIVTSVLGGALAIGLLSGPHTRVAAQAVGTATPTPAPPVQGAKKSVFMTVDTVQGTGGSPAPAVGCSQTNLFRRGQQVVFRMWGINAKLGGVALTKKNVTSVQITIPGLAAPIAMNYGSHGTVSFWAAPWKIDLTYPLGVVDFSVVVKTKANKKLHVKSITSTFTQQGLATPSRLTVTP